MSMSIRVVELFAGVGGFRVGLNRASKAYDFVWANQWEPGKTKQYAFECYVHHFGSSANHVNEDISKVKDQIPEHDLLVGGFPCQDYSVAATGAKGIQGKKGVLWWEIRDILESKRPKYVLLENVDRLIKSPSSQRGRDFGIMLKSLDDLGYVTEWRVINAADYGHAQRRRRVFIFAYLKNSDLFANTVVFDDKEIILDYGIMARTFNCLLNEKKKPISIELNEFDSLVDMTQRFKGDFHNAGICRNGIIYSCEVQPIKIESKTLRSVLESGVTDKKYYISDNIDKWVYLKGSKKIPRVKPNGELYNYSEGAISFPEKLDFPSRTMLTSESSVNRSTHVVEDLTTKKLRVLTEIECERLNEFDDNWTNTGMPNKFRYFCMGNALVTGLIERIGLTLVEELDN